VGGASQRARRRRIRFGGLRRWLIVGAVCLVALLYYRPVRSYLDTRRAVAARQAEVRQLQAEHDALQRRVELTQSGANLLRAARRLSLVKPGERLFIVKGIPQWRREHGRRHRP
jgi:cell division protein FtsB